ncbi:hypothetical protein RSOL_022040, partial [Rhizoctonia solani AG-3 Rhs1AP]
MLKNVLELTRFPGEFENFALPSLVAGSIVLMSSVQPMPLAYEYGYLCFRVLVFSLNTCLINHGYNLDFTIERMRGASAGAHLDLFWGGAADLIAGELSSILGFERRLTHILDPDPQQVPILESGKLDMLLNLLYGDQKNFLLALMTADSLQLPDYSLLVRKEMHAHFIALLTGVSLSKAEHLISQGAQAANMLPLKVLYAQVDSMDKTLTAHKGDGKNAKELEPARVVCDMKKAEENFLNPLMDLTSEAIQQKWQIQIRGESRVRLPYAWDVHCWYDPELLLLPTSKVQTTGAWGFTLIRIKSVRQVFCTYRDQVNSVLCTLLSAPASLIVGLTWVTNALINHPKEGGEWEVLWDTLCVHAMVNGFLVPVQPLGIFFLQSLINDPCPQISTHQYLSLKSLSELVGLPHGGADSALVSLISCCKVSKVLV